MSPLDEYIEQSLIHFIREKFQNKDERQSLLKLMIREVNLQHMKESLVPVDMELARIQIQRELSEIDIFEMMENK